MIKKYLILSTLFFIGCSSGSDQSTSNKTDQDYAFAYDENFSQTLKTVSGVPVDLPDGIHAVKAFKSHTLYAEKFNLQLFITDPINLNFTEPDKTFLAYESSTYGFLSFSQARGFSDKEKLKKHNIEEKRQSDEYAGRVLTYSKNLAGTASFLRYSNTILPGYTLIEVAIPGPDVEAVYLYSGTDVPVGAQPILRITDKLKETDDLSSYGYLKIPLPQDIKDFYMNNCGSLCPP
jgi:hypothetical protein